MRQEPSGNAWARFVLSEARVRAQFCVLRRGTHGSEYTQRLPLMAEVFGNLPTRSTGELS